MNKRVDNQSVNFFVRTLSKTTSTNDEVKRALAAGAPEGLVVRALEQTAGRGRQGRMWQSPQGGLYVSFLVRPQVSSIQLPTLSLMAALAVRQALKKVRDESCAASNSTSHCKDTIGVKWPNDVVCAQGKLAGILTEVCNDAAIVGIGINVFPPKQEGDVLQDQHNTQATDIKEPSAEVDLSVTKIHSPAVSIQPSADKKNTAAYVSSLMQGDHLLAASRKETLDWLLEILVDEFESHYHVWHDQGFSACVAEYRACAWLQGRTVSIVDARADELISGKVCGIDDIGRLLLQTPDGVVAVSSGEAHIEKVSSAS